MRSYTLAAKWARRIRDDFLLGRTLHNLSQSLLTDSPERASKLLQQSIHYKRRAQDTDGLFAVYTGQGIIAGQAGKHESALRWFRHAEHFATRTGNLYERAHALHNQALTLSQLGQFKAAVRLSRKARAIAESLRRTDLIILTADGEAAHCYQLQDYKSTASLSMTRFHLKKKRGDIDGAIIALSDAGIAEVHLKHYAASKTYLRRAIALSKSTKNRSRLSICIRNYVYIWRAQGISIQSIPLLKRQILWAKKAKQWDLLVDLTELLAQLLVEISSPVPVIEKSWTQAIAVADAQGNLLKKIALLRQRYSWIRQLRNPDLAVGALQSFLKLTERRQILRKEHLEALDEIGTCLQNQEKYIEAEKYYLRAFNIVQRYLDGTVPGHLLNNYAELLRKTGRSLAAIPLYRQAIATDKSSSNVDGRLLTEHNLALALDDVGRTNEARQILTRIQKIARKEKLWEHFVRTQLAIANIHWLDNRRIVALRRYARVRFLSVQHQLQDLALQAALNEARLLQEMDRNKQAVSLLQSFRARFPSSEHCLNLFLTLGHCLIQQGQHKKAIKIFEKGLQCPQASYSPANVASLRTALCEANLQARQGRRSHVRIEQVLSVHMSPLKRIEMLRAMLFAVALDDMQKPRQGLQVQRLLDEVQQIARDNKQPTWISETYERLGHILWSRDKNAATQIYLAGIIKTVENDDLRGTVKLGTDLGSRLHRFGLVNGKRRVLNLEKQIKRWLQRQFDENVTAKLEQKNSKSVDWLIWPFNFALTILHRPDKGRKITLAEIAAQIQNLITARHMR